MPLNQITIVHPYFLNREMLTRQITNFGTYSDETRQAFRHIVVDSASEPPARLECLTLVPTELYRVKRHLRWNWLTSRNLGAHQAQTKWLLLTDIDHVLSYDCARDLASLSWDENRVYRFSRRTLQSQAMSGDTFVSTPYKPHPNSWFMTKEMFDRIGGYDERFAGYYGSDGEFRDRVRKHAGEPVMLEQYLLRVPREIVPDASTTVYGRKEQQDREGVERARRLIAKDPVPKRLTIEWERVA